MIEQLIREYEDVNRQISLNIDSEDYDLIEALSGRADVLIERIVGDECFAEKEKLTKFSFLVEFVTSEYSESRRDTVKNSIKNMYMEELGTNYRNT